MTLRAGNNGPQAATATRLTIGALPPNAGTVTLAVTVPGAELGEVALVGPASPLAGGQVVVSAEVAAANTVNVTLLAPAPYAGGDPAVLEALIFSPSSMRA